MSEGKKSGPLRWILLGCGGLLLLGLLCGGGFAGCLVYLRKATADEVNPIADTYLRAQPEIEAELGTLTSVKDRFLPFNVHRSAGGGYAEFWYDVTGPKGSGVAQVWFVVGTGGWQAVGCELEAHGKKFQIGVRPEPPRDRDND